MRGRQRAQEPGRNFPIRGGGSGRWMNNECAAGSEGAPRLSAGETEERRGAGSLGRVRESELELLIGLISHTDTAASEILIWSNLCLISAAAPWKHFRFLDFPAWALQIWGSRGPPIIGTGLILCVLMTVFLHYESRTYSQGRVRMINMMGK